MDHSILDLFLQSGAVAKAVMLALIAASIVSWAFIFQRSTTLRQASRALLDFEDEFWSGVDLTALYGKLKKQDMTLAGLAAIFSSGFSEFARLHEKPGIVPEAAMEGAQRAMRVASSRELDKLEQHLPFLASVGSVSPYVGLFGTVWGIMTAFQALGAVQQATISMVAPGISEALIATAMGLFAAIPAVIAYNRFSSQVDRLANHYHSFQEEFASILYRQANANLA